jgi:Fringe-like
LRFYWPNKPEKNELLHVKLDP